MNEEKRVTEVVLSCCPRENGMVDEKPLELILEIIMVMGIRATVRFSPVSTALHIATEPPTPQFSYSSIQWSFRQIILVRLRGPLK
jgi:hypothetical protein